MFFAINGKDFKAFQIHFKNYVEKQDQLHKSVNIFLGFTPFFMYVKFIA